MKVTGLVSLIPNNIELVGVVTEYFKNPRASILTTNCLLRTGDEVLCNKNGQWIKGIVQSIQLNDAAVDSAETGEIGMVLDMELAKGFRIYKRNYSISKLPV